jgi:hypothetical protein
VPWVTRFLENNDRCHSLLLRCNLCLLPLPLFSMIRQRKVALDALIQAIRRFAQVTRRCLPQAAAGIWLRPTKRRRPLEGGGAQSVADLHDNYIPICS